MKNSLIEAIAPSSVLWGFDRCMFGEFPEFPSLDQTVKETIYLDRLPDDPFDFVSGHIALASLKARFPRARIMTVMQEPRIRLISYFLHWRSHSEEELALWGSYAARIRLSHGRLSGFLLSTRIANMTTGDEPAAARTRSDTRFTCHALDS